MAWTDFLVATLERVRPRSRANLGRLSLDSVPMNRLG